MKSLYTYPRPNAHSCVSVVNGVRNSCAGALANIQSAAAIIS